MSDASKSLSQYIEKLLFHRGKRDIKCRVYPPAGNLRTYSIILEGRQFREQFFLDARHVEEFAKGGNDQSILTELRTAFRNVEKRTTKRNSAGRP